MAIRIDLGSRCSKGRRIFRLRYFVSMASIQHREEGRDAAAEAEAVRLQRLREDAKRPMSVNLAETIALSHALLKMAASAQRQ